MKGTSKHEQRQRQQIKERQKKPKKKKNNNNILQKGVGGKSQRQNMEFEREDKRKTRKHNRIRRKKDFKDKPFGGTKKTRKLQENCLFGLIPNKKAQERQEIKTQPPKTKELTKKHLFYMLANNPYFW